MRGLNRPSRNRDDACRKRARLSAGLALAACTLCTPVLAQQSPPASDESQAIAKPPPPPADADLPEVEPIVSDEEFEEAVPDLDAENDPELDRPLESIAEFERRQAAADEAAVRGDEVDSGADSVGGVQIPALADGDAVEEIGDAPITDVELAAPLPPIESFDAEPVEFAEEASDSETVELAYAVRVTGLEAADAEAGTNLADMFDDLSALEDGDGKVANVAMLSARLDEDGQLIQRILASEGYYDATIATRIDRSEAANGQPLAAVIDVVPGNRYTFSDIVIEADPTVPPGLIRDNLALEAGQPIVAERVQGAEANVALKLPETGYPFAKLCDRDILLDGVTGDGVYTLPVDTGPRVRFGSFETTGNLAFDTDHVAVLSRFERGELYDSRQVDDLRQALVATGLFSTVSVEPTRSGENAGDDTEYVTMLVRQEAGPPRTIAGSAGYGTGQGFRVEGSWTHRNLFAPEGALIARAVAGTQEQGAGLSFRRSNAGRRDRTVALTAEALHSNYDAFEAFTGRLAGRISYESTPIWQKTLTYAYGVQLIGTNEQDFDFALGDLRRRTFFIGGLTGQVGFDRSDSLLNPTRGFRATALIEPEGSLQGGFTPYVRARIDGSAYYPVGDAIVLAGRVRLATIQGIERFDLAPSRRFYGGGGGSVRGFGYQQLGPKALVLNPDFDPTDPDEEDPEFNIRPIGGRSVNEAAAEVRYRFGNFGVVGFVDAGQVYDSALPEFSNIRFGAGLGGRFYTNFGPLRVDVATPIGRKEGESLISVYVSIGQAF